MPLRHIDILHVDTDILVVSKPTRMLSVPGRAEDNKDSLILRLNQHGYPDALIVHRLDWETTGLMVLARNKSSHSELSRQFRQRQVQRSYIALCWGRTNAEQGRIELPMRYDPPNKPRQTLDFHQGKAALTYWRKLAEENGHSRLLLTPHTGRSHQLRVHLLALGHPILGDPLYAHQPALQASDRMCLHARQLAFCHPHSGQQLEFIQPAGF